MTNANQLSPAIIDIHRRFHAFFSARVATPEMAERVLHGAYFIGGEEETDLQDDEKIAPWFYKLLRTSLNKTEYKRKGIDKDLRKLVGASVVDIVAMLKPDQAELIRKGELQEKSLKDLAHQARTSPVDIRLRLHRAREALKKKLMQAAGACAEHASMDCPCHRR